MEVNQDKIAAHKLMLLYLLHHAQTPLSEERLSEICAQLGLMKYFDLKANLHDLTENQLISAVEQINGRFFSVTETGCSTLSFFQKNLLFSTRSKIDTYLQAHKQELCLEASISAEYIRLSEHQYRVILRILEKNIPAFEISFLAESAAEADKYVTAWRTRALHVYRSTFETLLSKQIP